jgi:hypothetical protein
MPLCHRTPECVRRHAVRRIVRVTDAFFEQLDTQLGADRGPQGAPSATDFLVLELPPIVDDPGSTISQRWSWDYQPRVC